MMLCEVKGVSVILSNLKKGLATKAKQITKGLKKGGLFLQRESQLIVPVDTSTLKNTAFTRQIGSDARPDIVVGYNTSYAVFVHEDLDARHKPGKQAKFLEAPARAKRKEILQIIVDEAKK
jgi:hypothetical protein